MNIAQKIIEAHKFNLPQKPIRNTNFQLTTIAPIAQMHVKKALEMASEKAELDYFNGGCPECGSNKINKESILNSYNLNNIK